jgi:hypothetical protein
MSEYEIEDECEEPHPPGCSLAEWPGGVTVVCDGVKSDMDVSQLFGEFSDSFIFRGLSVDDELHITVRVVSGSGSV